MKLTTICRFPVALLLGASLFASTALAGSLTMAITDVVGSGSYGGDLVAPYVMTIWNGGETTTALVACDDFQTSIGMGYQWSGSVFSLTSAVLPDLKFSILGSQELITYEEAAIIFTDLSNGLTPDAAGSAAIWWLFEPDKIDLNLAPGAQAELVHAAAAAAAGGLNYSGVQIYTPNPLSASQEFIGGAVTPAPEPATCALLGTGLVLLGWAGRRTGRR